MKVLFNPQVSSQKTNSFRKGSMVEKPIEIESGKKSLPNVQKLGVFTSTISFGSKVSVTNQRLLDKIKSLEIEKKALLSTEISKEVQDAFAKLLKIKNWDSTKVREEAERWAKYYGNCAKEAHVKDHGSVWQFFNGDGSSEYWSRYNSEMRTRYYDKKDEIDELKKHEKLYQEIVDLANKNEIQKRERLREIEELIISTRKLINYQSIQDDINEMLSAKGGLTDRIAGYEEEKQQISTLFVDLLAKAQTDPTTEVPSAILLYGPTGTGKTTFLQAIKDQSKDYAFSVDLSDFKGAAGFDQVLKNTLREAEQRYIDENKRTILIINDAEGIFTISEREAKILGIDLDEQDKVIISAAGENFDKVANFKQLLDTISKIPDGISKGGRYATTLFITTNYPHLIHPDLLTREGKITKFSIGLAKDRNLEDILKFYFKKMDAVAERFRALKGHPEYESIIDSTAGITKNGRENIKKMIKNGTIDDLRVNWQKMAFDKIVKNLNPNAKEGAYSNDGLRVICQKAFLNYLDSDPEKHSYLSNFVGAYKSRARDINPQRYAKFEHINSLVKDKIINIETLESVLETAEIGELSEYEESILVYHLELMKYELENLKDREFKHGLSEKEIARKEELLEFVAKIDEYFESKKKGDD